MFQSGACMTWSMEDYHRITINKQCSIKQGKLLSQWSSACEIRLCSKQASQEERYSCLQNTQARVNVNLGEIYKYVSRAYSTPYTHRNLEVGGISCNYFILKFLHTKFYNSLLPIYQPIRVNVSCDS